MAEIGKAPPLQPGRLGTATVVPEKAVATSLPLVDPSWRASSAVVQAPMTPRSTTLQAAKDRGVFAQLPNHCGPTAIATVLRELGLTPVDPRDGAGSAQLQRSLYDRAYNRPDQLATRAGKSFTADDTRGVHPTGMLEILRTVGLNARWNDGDFDRAGAIANAEGVPGGDQYLERRLKQIDGVSRARQLKVLEGVRADIDAGIAKGNPVLVRVAWGNRPEYYHWNVVLGADRDRPGHYIVGEPGEGQVLSLSASAFKTDCSRTESTDQRCLKGAIVIER